jgi:hypothetical protein
MPASVTDRFHIAGSKWARPDAARVIYADGAGAGEPAAGDVELSHWAPNQTAAEYKADRSTEIRLRYASSPSRRDAPELMD